MRMRAMLERTYGEQFIPDHRIACVFVLKNPNGPGGPSSICSSGLAALSHRALRDSLFLEIPNYKSHLRDLHRHIRRCIRIDVLLRKVERKLRRSTKIF